MGSIERVKTKGSSRKLQIKTKDFDELEDTPDIVSELEVNEDNVDHLSLKSKVERRNRLAKNKVEPVEIESALYRDVVDSDSELGQHPVQTLSTLGQEHFLRNPSEIDFMCLKKLPKSVMRFIIEARAVNGKHIIHTEDLKENIGKSCSHISNIIYRLVDQGFIRVHAYNNNGTRVVEVNKSIHR